MSYIFIRNLRETLSHIGNVIAKFFGNCKKNVLRVRNDLNEYGKNLLTIYDNIPKKMAGLRSRLYNLFIALMIARDTANDKIELKGYKWDDTDRKEINRARKTIKELTKIVIMLSEIF